MQDSCLHILKDFPIKGALDLISAAPGKKEEEKWNQRTESTGIEFFSEIRISLNRLSYWKIEPLASEHCSQFPALEEDYPTTVFQETGGHSRGK